MSPCPHGPCRPWTSSFGTSWAAQLAAEVQAPTARREAEAADALDAAVPARPVKLQAVDVYVVETKEGMKGATVLDRCLKLKGDLPI